MIVKKGDKVSVEYEGKLESGAVFDSSSHGDHSHPLEFEVGAGHVIADFENAVIGMNLKDTKNITITPREAYGERDIRLEQKIARSLLPAGQEPKEGMMLMMRSSDDQHIPATIMKVTANEVTLDLNHPLAGKTLLFSITVVKIG